MLNELSNYTRPNHTCLLKLVSQWKAAKTQELLWAEFGLKYTVNKDRTHLYFNKQLVYLELQGTSWCFSVDVTQVQ